jgi:F-type H+-transporting ATPase subunit b
MTRLLKLRTYAILLAIVSLPAACSFAQTPERSGNSTASNPPAYSAPEQGPENSGNDENAQFKHSASVQLLSRITGLSLEGAYWLAVILNFAIVAGVIIWASKKNLPGMFRSRTGSIQKAIEEARKASEDAHRRLSEVESRLSRLGDEIDQMRAASEKEAAAEEERIKAAAAEDARRIAESASQEISAATKAARHELTQHAADLAVSLAAKQIRVDAATDEALVRRFARQISNGSSGSKS